MDSLKMVVVVGAIKAVTDPTTVVSSNTAAIFLFRLQQIFPLLLGNRLFLRLTQACPKKRWADDGEQIPVS